MPLRLSLTISHSAEFTSHLKYEAGLLRAVAGPDITTHLCMLAPREDTLLQAVV